MALKWAITNRVHEYLYGGQFNVYTDNNPLMYILSSAKHDVMGQRWVASLTNYDFRIFYKIDKTNVEADALSRIPRQGHTILDVPTVKAAIKAVPHTDLSEYNFHPTDIVRKSTQVVVHKKLRDDWQTEQENDPIIGSVIEAIRSKNHHTSQMNIAKGYCMAGADYCFVVVCYIEKCLRVKYKKISFQLVLPKSYWKQSLEACHDNMGHLGIERTTSLLRDRFYWLTVIEDIEHHLKSCPRCLRFKTQPEKAELNPIIATDP